MVRAAMLEIAGAIKAYAPNVVGCLLPYTRIILSKMVPLWRVKLHPKG